MLLRNLNPSEGHCNGSRYIVRNMMRNVIECELVTGSHAGARKLMPRIIFETLENYAFHFERRQFPLRLAFAMTANRSQGQSMKKVGVYLSTPFFTHGQLYVACSRVTSPEGLKICIDEFENETNTENIVFKDMLAKRLDKQMTPMSVLINYQDRNLPPDPNEAPWRPPIVIEPPTTRARQSSRGRSNPSFTRNRPVNQGSNNIPTSSNRNNRSVVKSYSMLRADQIAISHGLEHRSIVETKGDGNCFFHAVSDQCNDPEIRGSILDRARDVAHDHLLIRAALAEYCRNDQELLGSPWIYMREDYIDELEGREAYQGMSRDQILEDQLQYIATPGKWAKDIFITATALFFGKDINLYGEGNYRYTHEGSTVQHQTQPSPPMTIVHLNQNHFQSIRRQ